MHSLCCSEVLCTWALEGEIDQVAVETGLPCRQARWPVSRDALVTLWAIEQVSPGSPQPHIL